MAIEQTESAVRVTRDSVLEAIKIYVDDQSKQFFTTLEIARQMGVDEYSVRVAFSWLARYEQIEIVPGVRSIRYTGTAHEKYSATVYQIREEATEVDFAALNRAFGYSM